ncbi:MAG: hypothetical protein LQ338_004938 [Usnochroma carphineum]|nr:MAG: hypothetical protein LQ338_004938 [Usnochroma carphineum]
MTSNSAAWLVGEKVKPLEVKEAPYTLPGEDEILVKNAAVAVNPVDWAIQEMAIFPITYPTILGADVAGEVVEVGQSVTKFKKGDRVLGFALGQITHQNRNAGFQQYTVIPSACASIIPDTLSFERASVLPLCHATAAAALYLDNDLHLQYPSLHPTPTGKSVLIWGGASSVGSNAIQLAVASGYHVLTTASSKNTDYVKELGASQVFDYKKPDVIDEIVAAMDSRETVGIFDAVSTNGAIQSCLDVAAKTKKDKFVVTVRQPPKELPEGVTAKMCFASEIKDNEVGKAVFDDFLPQALANGKFVAAPDPHVIGHGLEHVQAGLDYLKAGVSAEKIVITL